MRPNSSVDVVIPTYRPGRELCTLLCRLCEQTVLPRRILIINTEEALLDPSVLEGLEVSRVSETDPMPPGQGKTRIFVHHIRKEEFDHGGTRKKAARMLALPQTDNGHAPERFLLYMTQDAMPADRFLLENLLEAFGQDRVCAAYARQLPAADCSRIEQLTRARNYGSEKRLQTASSLPKLGIRTYYCSNVCAMYRRSEYEKLGGFVSRTIFNEDMIFASGLIRDGKAICYCPQARVVHSHNYTWRQQFHRNFDLGVSHAMYPEVFASVPSEGTGIRLVKDLTAELAKQGRAILIPGLVWESGWKYAGYWLGKHYRRLPKRMVKWCSASPSWWEKTVE